jgi:FkbM family methyltransferase
MFSIAIIDILGLTYDGTTLNKRGLGGSESAVILMSKELSKLGFSVTVFNNCLDKEASEGIYDGVNYVDLSRLYQENDYKFDIVISSRTLIPFVSEQYWGNFNPNPIFFRKLKQNAKLKIVWMHDTFCGGDHLIEEHIINGDIDELFTLSDFHTSYVTSCAHGPKRNFEVLKDKVFITRNGIVNYFGEVDISKKDRNLFVYNASVTKGMLPLVQNIWERVKQKIPDAKLKVIGGYYRFRENAEPDEQEKTWRELVKDPKYANLDIEFTGIIKQKEIAEILSNASYMIYPGAFPETFGISSLESLCYNTPLITTRFGALEETAIDQASYFIDYAIEPNGLYPHINKHIQEDKFVNLVEAVYNNPYLHQQKMYYCNIIKDVCEWSTVALQWKQHLYKKLGAYLPIKEYRKVQDINYKIHKIFGRRHSNKEEWYEPKRSEQRISVVSTFYNAENFIEKCILSVASQNYDNYCHILVNDCSTDNSQFVAEKAIQSLPKSIQSKFILMNRKENQGAVYNQIMTFRDPFIKDDDIVMILDGDDWLVNEPDIFDFYNNLYHNDTEFSYGSCWSVVDNIPLISQPYPKEILEKKAYRQHKFNWGLPYTHLRTFRKRLINDVNDSVFLDENGNWFRAGGDVATFYNIIEQADPNKVKCVTRIVYNYNDANPLNDYKINSHEQTKNAEIATKKREVKMKSILIGIPTAKYIEPQTFKSIYDLEIPEGYKVDFQYFYGYNIDQVRNLIAHWAANYDYLFSVDSDIAFEKDTLRKLLSHDKDMVSGLYIQRKPDVQILEIYEPNQFGGVTNIPYEKIKYHKGLLEIAGCGFGCVLIKSEVIKAIGYPQFVYKSAIDHRNTISEDVYFCRQALEKGFKIYADTTIMCDHIGSTNYKIVEYKEPPVQKRLRELSEQRLIPQAHYEYLIRMRDEFNVRPKIIYDIGAAVLHWTNLAKHIWNDSEYIAFEAMSESEFLFQESNMKYHIGVLSDCEKTVNFYKNVEHPGGNSYYKENEEVNPNTIHYFNESHRCELKTVTLDSVIKQKGYPYADLIKMDVQGAELDVLRGAADAIAHCNDLILELQCVEYNKGAPLRENVIEYLQSIGFELVTGPFCDNGPDGDYHFRRKTI